MQKRTKIVATIGPASDSFSSIKELILSGVNVFRLNFSHNTHEYHKSVLLKIKKAEKELEIMVGVLQDISGPKIRVGNLKENFILDKDDILRFVKEDILGTKQKDGFYELCVNHKKVLQNVNLGDFIYLSDGAIKAKAVEILKDCVLFQVENSGILSSKKGLSFPNTSLNINIITNKDKKDIAWGIRNSVNFMAISFVQNADDIRQVRDILKESNANIHLYAKIEKFDAIKNIDEILKVSDGIMVARGDLGVEVPFYKVPAYQKMLIQKANTASKPVITATQMLFSMTQKETSTRAEISDIANAVLDGTDAVMLSEESAIGVNPSKAVKTMAKAIMGAEEIYNYNKLTSFSIKDTTESLEVLAVGLAKDINADGMIVLSSSGNSVRKISRYKPNKEIFAIVHDKKVARELSICWGVSYVYISSKDNLKKIMSRFIKDAISLSLINIKKRYILSAGDPVGLAGSTNMIKILREEEMIFYSKKKSR